MKIFGWKFEKIQQKFEKLSREKKVEIVDLVSLFSLNHFPCKKTQVDLVDLVKGFPTHIWSQKSASIQPRTDWSVMKGTRRWPYGQRAPPGRQTLGDPRAFRLGEINAQNQPRICGEPLELLEEP